MKKQLEIYTAILLSNNKPINSRDIAKKCETTESYVRKAINSMRSMGVPICSTHSGYYYSAETKEINKTIAFLKSRIETQLKAIYGLEKAVKNKGE